MGKVKSSEQIQRELQEYRIKKQLKHQRELQRRRKQRQELQKEFGKRFNQRLREERQRRAQELIERLRLPKHEKRERLPNLNAYVPNNLIWVNPYYDEEFLYQTWDEVMEDESGRLNPNFRDFIKRVQDMIHNI